MPCSLIATFCFALAEFCIIFERDDVYLNEPIKTDELIKLANQSIQRRSCDRNEKDNNSSYFWNQKIS